MNNNDKDIELNPDFITGLADAEGCFSVNVFKDKKTEETLL